jgi:transposase
MRIGRELSFGARAQLVGMMTRLSNMIPGVLKTFGLLPGAGRGLRFDRRVAALLEGVAEVGLIVHPLLATWRQLREQIAVFDKQDPRGRSDRRGAAENEDPRA